MEKCGFSPPQGESSSRLSRMLTRGARAGNTPDMDIPLLGHAIARESGITREVLLPCIPLMTSAFNALSHQYYPSALYNRPLQYASLSQSGHATLPFTFHQVASQYQLVGVAIPSGEAGMRYQPSRRSACSVAIAPSTTCPDLPQMTGLGEEFQTALVSQRATDQSGAVLNVVSGAGHMDLSSLMLLAAQVRSAPGTSCEEAAPARLCLMRLTWRLGHDLPLQMRVADQFVDWKILREGHTPTRKISLDPRKVELCVTTLDHFMALKTGAQRFHGWGVLRVNDFNTNIAVVPVHSRDLESDAIWHYIASFVDTRVWQGLHQVDAIGTLNWDLVDQEAAARMGYTESSEFYASFDSYSDNVIVPGPVNVLLVIMDQTSRVTSSRLMVGPIDNSVQVELLRPNVEATGTIITRNVIRAITGVGWDVDGEYPRPADDDVYVAAQSMLEDHVITGSAMEAACGLVSALAFRVKAPMLKHARNTSNVGVQFETSRVAWLMSRSHYTHDLGATSALRWMALDTPGGDTGRISSDMTNYEAQWWFPSGQCGYHSLITSTKDQWMDQPYGVVAPVLGKLTQASDVARLWRSAGMALGPSTPMMMRTGMSFELFFRSNASMLAAAVGVAQSVLGIPYTSWTGYYAHDARWNQWMTMLIEVVSLGTLVWPGRVARASLTGMASSLVSEYNWVTNTAKLTEDEAILVCTSAPYALQPQYIMKFWFTKIEGVWDNIQVPPSEQYVVESHNVKVPMYGRMWRERLSWASLMEFSSEIPLERGRSVPDWFKGIYYVTAPLNVYTSPALVGFNTVAFSCSLARHEALGAGQPVLALPFQSGQYDKFEQVEAASVLIPHIFVTAIKTAQAVFVDKLNKLPNNAVWEVSLVADNPDPWYNWLADAMFAALPFLVSGHPILGLGAAAVSGGVSMAREHQAGRRLEEVGTKVGKVVLEAVESQKQAGNSGLATDLTKHEDG